MPVSRLLIANRGEIAIRIARAAAELGIQTLAIYAEDDASSLHTRQADQTAALKGRGASAYLDQQQIIDIASAQGCDAVHPGYGFLSENAEFARRCEATGLTFVGPSADVLEVFGDKARARDLARDHGVALAAGSNRATSQEDAERFFRELPAGAGMMIKALAGGGGRGMRAVRSVDEIPDAYARCQAEARAAFGDDRLYVERLIQRARHIEVQVIGDGRAVSHLWERDCTLQRRNQKLLEIAPSPNLHPRLRGAILAAAVRLAEAVNYRGLGTFEFLLDEDSGDFVFMEANPRLQVEHTVTEAVTGIDLVQAQLRIAAGASLADLNLTQAEIPTPRGHALQLRINLESLANDGTPHLACGTLSAYEPPSGPGLRVDGYGYAGYRNSAGYDSLLAKLIVHRNGGYPQLVQRAYRALCEFRLEGVASNIPLLLNLLRQTAVADNQVTTRYIEEHLPALLGAQDHAHPHRFFSHAGASPDVPRASEAPAGCIALATPSAGVPVSLNVAVGDAVAQGQTIAVIEAMKMEFEVKASASGIVHSLAATPGDSLGEGDALLFVEPADIAAQDMVSAATIDLDAIRADLAEVLERHAIGLDERRPEAVAKRHRIGKRTTRENLADLLDEGSFIEYGALAIAAQRRRRSVEELIASSPADGLVSAWGASTPHSSATRRRAAWSWPTTTRYSPAPRA